jgi:2-polyprenyl-3-methyl-5-hydroxy-6-metoxy-1,4-benzoquinol methylase
MDVRDTLAKPTIHEHWEDRYRTAENERLYEQAFAAHLRKGAVLDVGCGIGAHSDRLARREFRVVEVDVPDRVLAQARRAHPAVTFGAKTLRR